MTIRYFIYLLARFLNLTNEQQLKLYSLLIKTNMKRNRDYNSSPTNKRRY